LLRNSQQEGVSRCHSKCRSDRLVYTGQRVCLTQMIHWQVTFRVKKVTLVNKFSD
jgi:hypothetical protein